MKLIGINCEHCGATVLDNGTQCPRCSIPYPPEVLAMGQENRAATGALIKTGVDPDQAVIALKAATEAAAQNTRDQKPPGILARIRYWLAEFYNPKTP